MPEGLKIGVEADVQQAVRALRDVAKASEVSFKQVILSADKAGASLTGLQKNVQAFGGGIAKSLAAIPTGFNRLPPSINRAGAALNKLANTSSAATQSTINLSRVIQDAPYGFLGIANNLNPLLESFQRLKATTGSTGGALKALGKSLTGAGGIGLALGIVSSLLVVFGDRLFGVGKKTKEAADELKRINEVIKSVSGSFAERSSEAAAGVEAEIATINTLTSVVLDQTKTYQERNNALLQLKDINKNYFGDLTLESASLQTLTSRVAEYTNALIAAAVVKEFSSDIAKTSVEAAKALNQYNKLGKELDKLNIELSQTRQFITYENNRGVAVKETTAQYSSLTSKIKDTNKALEKQGSIVDKLGFATAESRAGLQTAIEESLKFKPLKVTAEVKTDDKAAEKLIQKTITRGKQLADAFKEIFAVVPEFTILDSIQQQFQKALSVIQNFETAGFDFKIPFNVEVVAPPDEIKQAATTMAQLYGKEFNRYFEGGQFDPSIGKAISEELRQQKLAQALGLNTKESPFTQMERDAIFAADAITNSLSPAFQGLFDAILAGESPLKAFFTSLAQSVAQLIQKLIAAAIQAAILSALFPGGVGQVKGFGGFFKNILGFAAGGIVSGPTLALIGEGAGTSRSNPEVVAPLDQLRSMLAGIGGGGAQTVYVTGRLRGRDMVLQNARTSRSQRRTTGR